MKANEKTIDALITEAEELIIDIGETSKKIEEIQDWYRKEVMHVVDVE